MSELTYDLMLFEDTFAGGADSAVAYDCGVGAVYVASGAVLMDGAELSTGDGAFVGGPFTAQPMGDDPVTLIRWEISAIDASANKSENLPATSTCKAIDRITVPSADIAIRLDTVTFPPGTRAYNHIHAVPGTRYLLRGSLEINSEHSVDLMTPGTPWFEVENSAVVAIAHAEIESQFVRVLVLNPEYIGKPTITYVDPADNDKPREQINNRLFDHPARLEG